MRIESALQRRKLVWAAAVCGAMTSPVYPEEWTVPAGCKLYLTVQSKECIVSNHYRCSGDPEGYRWQADFDPKGLKLLTQTDAEAVPVRIDDPRASRQWLLDAGSTTLPTVSAVLIERVTYPDYRMIGNNGETTQIRGFRQQVPESTEAGAPLADVVIDGVPLKAIMFNIDRSGVDGAVQSLHVGTEYLQSEWRLVFPGPEQRSEAGNLSAFRDGDRSPVDFIFPGEPGFGTTQPTEDCELLLTELSSAPTVTQARTRQMP
jgi:hypothetical protein